MGGLKPKRKQSAHNGRERKIAVLLVDRRSWTREALARALEKSSRGVRVIRCGDAAELSSIQTGEDATLILLNVTGTSLTANRVAALLAEAREALPGIPVVMLSDSHDAEQILSAIEAGLNGYIPMSLELGSVVEALHFVAAGGTFVPAEPLLASLDAEAAPKATEKPSAPAPGGRNAELATLTARELAVLDLLRQAKSNKHIARELDLSEATVKVHVRHIMRKIGAVNRTQVALLAERILS